MTKKTSNRFSPEVRQRAVRMVLDHGGDHASQWAAIGSIAAKIGCTAETLRGWVRQAERDQGKRAGPTSDDRERIKGLGRELPGLRHPQGLAAVEAGRHRRGTMHRSYVAAATRTSLQDSAGTGTMS